jgi:hypothetical protein
MRTVPALRTLAAALLTGCAVTGTTVVAAAGPAAAAPTSHTTGGGGSGHPIWGTIVSGGDLNLRLQPTTRSPVVGTLSPGSQDRVECAVSGQSVSGNTVWFWLVGAHAWASAAFVDIGERGVPDCSDPCPDWKDGSWNNSHDNGSRHHDPCDDPGWKSTGSGRWSFSVTSSWSWTVSGSTSDSWDWVPGGG